ncbi:MAG: Holliday junction resolvase RuvX [Verrucomicrobiae bacterium]|nr:Holliday junction resolvase RuvX [Verrucomicrobiae bacterium]
MKVAAIDYGTRRVGLAISDELGMFAHPLAVVESDDPEKRFQQVSDILEKSQVTDVLIGLPKHMDGSEREEALAVKAFACKLEQLGRFSVKLRDERLSTVQASRLMREAGRSAKQQKSKIDAAAAVVLLQAYLDSSD